MQREKRRREQHRQRHHHHQQLRGGRGEHAQARGGGKQHERELAALGQRCGQPLRRVVGRAAGARDGVHEGEFGRHQAKGQTDHRRRLLPHQVEIGAHAYGDEKQTEQQSFERLDVRFEFVAEFRIGEQHAGEKGAERHRQADLLHDQRGADDEQQSRRGEHLAPAVARGALEHRAHHQPAPGDNRDDHRHSLECGHPVGARMHGVRPQQRQQRQHRDH